MLAPEKEVGDLRASEEQVVMRETHNQSEKQQAQKALSQAFWKQLKRKKSTSSADPRSSKVPTFYPNKELDGLHRMTRRRKLVWSVILNRKIIRLKPNSMESMDGFQKLKGQQEDLDQRIEETLTEWSKWSREGLTTLP